MAAAGRAQLEGQAGAAATVLRERGAGRQRAWQAVVEAADGEGGALEGAHVRDGRDAAAMAAGSAQREQAGAHPRLRARSRGPSAGADGDRYAAEPARTGATATICVIRCPESGDFAASGPLSGYCTAMGARSDKIPAERPKFVLLRRSHYPSSDPEFIHGLIRVALEAILPTPRPRPRRVRSAGQPLPPAARTLRDSRNPHTGHPGPRFTPSVSWRTGAAASLHSTQPPARVCLAAAPRNLCAIATSFSKLRKVVTVHQPNALPTSQT